MTPAPAPVALLSLSQTAVFEFHLQSWLGAERGAKAVIPELLRMKGVRARWVYGADETDSAWAMHATKSLQILKPGGGITLCQAPLVALEPHALKHLRWLPVTCLMYAASADLSDGNCRHPEAVTLRALSGA